MSADKNKLRVLLVDDEPDIVEVMKKGLEQNGFNVGIFTKPQTALTEYSNNHYDIHVLDIRMPGMSGFDLARGIWEINPDAKVCFFTSFEILEPEAKRVLPNLRTHCFLKKPITPNALAQHILSHMVEA